MMNNIILFIHLKDIKEHLNAKRIIWPALSEKSGSTKELPRNFHSFNVWKRQLEVFSRARLAKLSDLLPATKRAAQGTNCSMTSWLEICY